MKEQPFIHLFRTSKCRYCYDVNTDNIIKLPVEIYEYLDGKIELTENINDYVNCLTKMGFLKSKKVMETKHPVTDYLPYYYSTKLNFLILQVTQNCNLRCEYCVYSGKYKTRIHNHKKMDFAMAKRGIDYLYDHSRDSLRIVIGFYGGEPLLEIDLIKKCVEYIESNYYGKKVIYSLTTNATLLKGEILDFLVDKNFDLTISLDGPKDVHDKSRHFVINNESSFNTIISNLKNIKKCYPEFYKNNVSFNTVFTMEDGFDCIDHFFKAEELFEDSFFSSGVVSNCFLKEEMNIGPNEMDYITQVKYELFKIMLYQMGEIGKNNISKLLRSEQDAIIKERFEKREINRKELPDQWHHGGPCVVGVNRLFLNADGEFYPCEKVCEGMNAVKIGNVFDGIDINKAKEVLNIEKLSEQDCHNCWAYQYCSVCATRFGDSDIVKSNHCKNIRRFVENKFKDYCVLKELGIDSYLYDVNIIDEI